jgi:hypothetical protein
MGFNINATALWKYTDKSRATAQLNNESRNIMKPQGADRRRGAISISKSWSDGLHAFNKVETRTSNLGHSEHYHFHSLEFAMGDREYCTGMMGMRGDCVLGISIVSSI